MCVWGGGSGDSDVSVIMFRKIDKLTLAPRMVLDWLHQL